jgi:hypothetical protein
MRHNSKKNIIRVIFLCAVTLFSQAKAQENTAQKWLSAVSRGDEKTALKLASEIIVSENISNTINPQYAEIAKQENITPDFFTAPFGKYDFKLWYDALFLKNKLKEFDIKKSTEGPKAVKIILDRVAARIKPLEKEHAIIPWPTGIWVRGFGLCDRQSWLFAELAYQAGYETQIVYLIDSKTGISPHTICEISINKENKISRFTADPYSKVLLQGVSVRELFENKKLMKKIWPGKENWYKALGNSIFWTPSYPQDYCLKNQKLYKILKSELKEQCPRFGEDPQKRLSKYRKYADKNSKFKMGLWYYPFRVLKREIDIHK